MSRSALPEPDREGGGPVRLRRHRARSGQRPRCAEDGRRAGRRQRRRDRLPDQRREAVDQQRRRGRPVHRPRPRPGRAELVRGRCRRRGLHARRARGQARHPAEQHRRAVPRQRPRRRRPAHRRRRGAGARAGPAGVRLHAADGGRVRARRRMGGARPGDPLLAQAHPGRRPAVREGGLHAQADRPARGRARGVEGGDRGDRRAPGRGRGLAERRGRDREVPRDRGGRRGGRRGHPGPRRLRLHARLHGREDQARRPDHQDLRGHLGDHGDDDRARALAGAPQVRRRPLPRAGARARGAPRRASRRRRRRRRARPPRARRAARALPRRAADPAPAHPAAPRRADRPGRGRGRARQARAAGGGQAAEPEGVAAPARRPLAAASRVYARGAALAVATEAVRWVAGADGGELGELEQRLDLASIHRAQGGLLADLDAVTEAVYGRMRR